MYYVDFCKAPSGRWIGWTTVDNGVYYSNGATLDELMKHIKTHLYQQKRISNYSVAMNSKQSSQEDAPTHVFKKMFMTKYWYEPNCTKKCLPVKYNTQTKTPQKPVEYERYIYETIDGVLYVYGVCKVAEYKIDVQPTENTEHKTQENKAE